LQEVQAIDFYVFELAQTSREHFSFRASLFFPFASISLAVPSLMDPSLKDLQLVIKVLI
jgi:hypothetical protein